MKTKKAPVKPTAVFGILKELKASAQQDRPIVVSGARGLVPVLVKELTRDGVAAAVREQGPLDDAAALVQVLAGEIGADDEARLKEAARRRLPIVAVALGVPGHIPYVLEENVVRVGSGTGFPVDEIARRLAKVLGERGTPARRPAAGAPPARLRRPDPTSSPARTRCSGRRLPARRRPAAADAEPGAASCSGSPTRTGSRSTRTACPEVLGVIGSGPRLPRGRPKTAGRVRFVGWAVKGAIAYTGTRALGEAAVRYFERRAPVTRVAGARVKL